MIHHSLLILGWVSLFVEVVFGIFADASLRKWWAPYAVGFFGGCAVGFFVAFLLTFGGRR